MRKPSIDHRSCDHPRTKRSRTLCRRGRAGLPQSDPQDRHRKCDHPATSAARTACNRRKREERVWINDGPPLVLKDIRDPDVRTKVRRIAAEQEARLALRLMACGLHITQR
ncbi:hypothetical protein Xph01_04230 [Micromonospora phaseoli]|nr:hypothetical protein Xph01_04230 [Micromonospora phaseoli]